MKRPAYAFVGTDLARGLLRIAVSAAFARLQLARWLPEFAVRYPELDVELIFESRYSDLVAEQLDVAVRLGFVQSSTLLVRKLCEMPRVMVASPARARSCGEFVQPNELPCLLTRGRLRSESGHFEASGERNGISRRARPSQSSAAARAAPARAPR